MQKNMPGYTGFKPQEESYQQSSVAREQGHKIPGYSGYVPGVKSENVFGESFGKTSGLSGNGQITRGFDQDTQEKFKSMSQASYQNQKELYSKMQAAQKPQPKQMGIDDVPKHIQAKFFGMQDHEQDRWTQSEKFQEAAVAFYGDGARLKEVYGKKGESFDEAAAKFYGSNKIVKQQDTNKVTMSYEEARQHAYNRP